VHRDVKPGNLLVGTDGIVKITDFGISQAVGSEPVTRTGGLIGTPACLAPELRAMVLLPLAACLSRG
jgi:serine/threonine protein kinase